MDRIEVLKDGASAIYGSDAVAGVVNILLKDEYQGADLKFYYGISSRGDYEVYHVSAVTGLSEKLGENSKLSLLATIDYYDQGLVLGKDRSYSTALQHSQFGSYYDQALTDAAAGHFGDAAGNTYTVIPGTANHAEQLYHQWSSEPVAHAQGHAIDPPRTALRHLHQSQV